MNKGFAILCNEEGLIERILSDDFSLANKIGVSLEYCLYSLEEQSVQDFIFQIKERNALFFKAFAVKGYYSEIFVNAVLHQNKLFVVGNESKEGLAAYFYNYLLELQEEQLSILEEVKQVKDEVRQYKGKVPDASSIKAGVTAKDIIRAQSGLVEKNAEIERLQSDLEHIRKTKSKLFSIISHDLRTPFTGLLSFTEYMADNHGEFSQDELTQAIRHIFGSAKELYKLLENLLQWSRLQSGQIKFRKEEVSLDILIAGVIQLYQSNIEAKDLKVQVDVSHKVHVTADSNALNVILRNIIGNAIKFTPQGGSVRIDAELDSFYLNLIVTDSGQGISRERLSQLFSLEEQKSTIGTAGEKGTGLGLLISHEFVQQMNGKMDVESKVGEGTIFHIKLPVA